MQNDRRAQGFLDDYFAVVKAQQSLKAVYHSQLKVLLANTASGGLPGPRIPLGVDFTDREKLIRYQKTSRALQELYRYRREYYVALMLHYQRGVNARGCAVTAKGNAALMHISIPTYKNYVRLGLVWLDGRFADFV